MGELDQRLTPLARSEWTQDVRATFSGHVPQIDRYLDDETLAVPPVIGILARHPRLAAAWLSLNGVLLDGEEVLPAELRELAILRVAWLTRCDYEWEHHAGIAQGLGLSAELIQAVAHGPAWGSWTAEQQAVLTATDEMARDHVLGDDTWQALASLLDQQQLIELMFLVGAYLAFAGFLNTIGIEAGAGHGVPDHTRTSPD